VSIQRKIDHELAINPIQQAVRQQMLQDDDVRNLAKSLHEMVGVAAECPDLPVIPSTTNVIEEIGRVSLQIALLIDEYAGSSLIGSLLSLLNP
jgi:hypothetical protein